MAIITPGVVVVVHIRDPTSLQLAALEVRAAAVLAELTVVRRNTKVAEHPVQLI
jgi:hypothetical protein